MDAALRATRQRDNKRRSRARQRELVNELRQRVNEGRHQDVKATKEVQVAAQKVVRENKRLRELLLYVGLDDVAVEAWLRGDENAVSICIEKQGLSSPLVTSPAGSTKPQTCSDSTPKRGNCLPSTRSCSGVGGDRPSISSSATEGDDQGVSPSRKGDRPCMSVAHFLNDPTTEWPQGDNAKYPENVGGDVECSRARQMVMPFASSHDKVEAMSQRLKQGCVVDSQNGGCKVKANVMWEVLEDVMKESSQRV